jgi:hypothetical protein
MQSLSFCEVRIFYSIKPYLFSPINFRNYHYFRREMPRHPYNAIAFNVQARPPVSEKSQAWPT